jgi:hypothetical protein
MRTTKSVLLVSALVVASVGGRAFGAVVDVDREAFKGSAGATTFSGSATIACAGGGSGTVTASGFLSGSQSITKSTGSPKTVNNGIFVEVDSYSNSCTGAMLGFADGGIANGFTPPNAHLNSAELAGTTTVQDFDTGLSISVAIDVVLEGTGPISAEKSTTKTKTKGPVTITITRSASASRAADASGTISVGGVAIDATFSSTTLSSNANATITITKSH